MNLRHFNTYLGPLKTLSLLFQTKLTAWVEAFAERAEKQQSVLPAASWEAHLKRWSFEGWRWLREMSEWRAQTQSLSFVQKNRICACLSAMLAARCQCAACQTAKRGLYPPDTRTNTRKFFPHFNGSPLELPTSERLSADRASSPFFVQSPNVFFFLLFLIQISSEVLVARSPCHRLAGFTTSVRRGQMDISQGICHFSFTLMEMTLWGIKQQTV